MAGFCGVQPAAGSKHVSEKKENVLTVKCGVLVCYVFAMVDADSEQGFRHRSACP